MQFVADGPSLPIEVLTAQEEGELVLFCGAGISKPHLPGFADLVQRVYTRIGADREPLEEEELAACHYDRVIELLERRFPRGEVRGAVAELLATPAGFEGELHRAILDLSSAPGAPPRLVTTNFDHLLEAAVGASPVRDIAPKLPVPKRRKWRSLVYLHGRIDGEADPEGNNLVLSSSDFGTAYLTEGWASRFVTELFLHFHVLFIGYQVEDPVLRYMLDALAADRATTHGSDVGPRSAFALVPVRPGEASHLAKWEAKHVTPIPFDPRDDYRLLRETIIKWAGLVRDGLAGRVRVATLGASIKPDPSYQDEQVQQVVWALRDSAAARAFAEAEPTPVIQWLPILGAAGLLSIPPAGEAGPVPLAGDNSQLTLAPPLHPTTYQLGRWLARHLREETLLQWALREDAGVLHPTFQELIRRRLHSTGGDDEPSARLRGVWHLLCDPSLTGRPRGSPPSHLLFGAWPTATWSAALRQQVLGLLWPFLELRPSGLYSDIWESLVADAEAEKPVSYYVRGEIRLNAGEWAGLLIGELLKRRDSATVVADLAEGLTGHLLRALDLLAAIDQADTDHDYSSMSMPSLAVPSGERQMYEWIHLVTLLRDGALEHLRTNENRGLALLETWEQLEYPLFVRLLLHCSSHSNPSGLGIAGRRLLHDGGRWLWVPDTWMEASDFLRRHWSALPDDTRDSLLACILEGPPAEHFAPGERGVFVDRHVWQYLASLEAAGARLPANGSSRLVQIRETHPGWPRPLDEEERQETRELTYGWVVPGLSPEELDGLAPPELVTALLEESRKADPGLEGWQKFAKQNPEKGVAALAEFASQGAWSAPIWQHGLHGIADAGFSPEQWTRIHSALGRAPVELLRECAWAVAYWLRVQSKALPVEDDHEFLSTWERTSEAAFATPADRVNDRVSDAINHPAGILTETLLERLWLRSPRAGSGIPDQIEPLLSWVADGSGGAFLAGRVVLASRCFNLFLVDQSWTGEHLLPRFSWDDPEEAAGMWDGFLWPGRLSAPLFTRLAPSFVEALRRHAKLGQFRGRLYQLFALACIEMPETIQPDEARDLLRTIGPEGRERAAAMLARLLKDSGEKATELWEHRIGPWIQSAWPRDLDCREPDSSVELVRVAIQARGVHAQAFQDVKDLLVPSPEFFRVVKELAGTALPETEPAVSLAILDAVVDESQRWPPNELPQVLDRIVKMEPGLAIDPAMRRLREYLLRIR